jgi:hypothetical protein
MTGPPAAGPCSNADGSARPTTEVRTEDGLLMKRVATGAAEQLVSRGWGEWRGRGCRRHVCLTPAAPLSSLHGWRGQDGTRPMRADQSCNIRGNGQLMGEPKSHREFIPFP